jgi:hypothetical protein
MCGVLGTRPYMLRRRCGGGRHAISLMPAYNSTHACGGRGWRESGYAMSSSW